MRKVISSSNLSLVSVWKLDLLAMLSKLDLLAMINMTEERWDIIIYPYIVLVYLWKIGPSVATSQGD